MRSRAHQRFRLAKCLFQRAGLVFVDLQGDRGYRDFQDSFVDVRVFWQLIQPRKPLTRRLETINANPMNSKTLHRKSTLYAFGPSTSVLLCVPGYWVRLGMCVFINAYKCPAAGNDTRFSCAGLARAFVGTAAFAL